MHPSVFQLVASHRKIHSTYSTPEQHSRIYKSNILIDELHNQWNRCQIIEIEKVGDNQSTIENIEGKQRNMIIETPDEIEDLYSYVYR